MIPALVLLGVLSIIRLHETHTIQDANRDETTGTLYVAVPVECQKKTRVWLNGNELRNGIDYRPTPNGIYLLNQALLVEVTAHRSRIKVTF